MLGQRERRTEAIREVLFEWVNADHAWNDGNRDNDGCQQQQGEGVTQPQDRYPKDAQGTWDSSAASQRACRAGGGVPGQLLVRSHGDAVEVDGVIGRGLEALHSAAHSEHVGGLEQEDHRRIVVEDLLHLAQECDALLGICR